MIRRPAVAGQFYESNPTDLKERIENCFLHHLGPRKKPNSNQRMNIAGLISPHAGYLYSGPIAAHAYYYASMIEIPELVIILGPNHSGLGSMIATMDKGIWKTPLGNLRIDEDMAKKLIKVSEIIDFSYEAHIQEHSIEVQLPFLQYVFGSDFKILPICMGLQDKNTSIEVGDAISKIARFRKTLIVASSDLTHYENQKEASFKDLKFINSILEMNISEMYFILQRLNVSACGYGPIASLLTSMKNLQVNNSKLLKYATSGDITGDKNSVVGYSSILFYR